MSRGTRLKCFSPLGKSSASLGKSASDLWSGMASHKSHVRKNWMPKHSKKKKASCQGRAQSWWRLSQVWEARVEYRWHKTAAKNAQASGFSQVNFVVSIFDLPIQEPATCPNIKINKFVEHIKMVNLTLNKLRLLASRRGIKNYKNV